MMSTILNTVAGDEYFGEVVSKKVYTFIILFYIFYLILRGLASNNLIFLLF